MRKKFLCKYLFKLEKKKFFSNLFVRCLVSLPIKKMGFIGGAYFTTVK